MFKKGDIVKICCETVPGVPTIFVKNKVGVVVVDNSPVSITVKIFTEEYGWSYYPYHIKFASKSEQIKARLLGYV